VRDLRVLHTVGNLGLGGGQKLVVLVATALSGQCIEVAVLSFGPPDDLREALDRHGIEVIDLGLRRPLRQNSAGTWFRAVRVLLKTLLGRRWDVVHTHMFLSSVVVTPLARLGRARVMGTTHRIYYEGVQPRIERLVALLQERIVVDSHAVGDILRASTRIPEQKYAVIHNGIDVSEFSSPPDQGDARRRLRLPETALVIGEVARLEPHKGQVQLVEAFAEVAATRPEAHLLLVGDGSSRDELSAIVADRGLQGRVHLPGAVADLATVLMALDVLALPSTFEGFGIVQAEAMYLRRPVVATSFGGSTEVVVDGETGFLVPFGDRDELAERLGRLLDDPDLRRRMGEAGRQRVIERFTSERMAAGYRALYLA
jgi:glycosyltransferase involved in cell wall biosynthesis